MLKEADKVFEYLNLGIGFEYLGLNIEFSEYLELLFEDSYRSLKVIMKDFDAFQFLRTHDKVKKGLKTEIMKENAYPLLLMLMTYLLSWFFLLFFTPNVISLVEDFDVSIGSIITYQNFVRTLLFFYHSFFILISALLFTVQFKDLKTMLFILLNKKFNSIRIYVSYRFALMLLLFLEAGIKTNTLIQIMRTYGLGDLSKWMAYHIQESLDHGSDLKTSFEQEFMDVNLIHFISLGIINQDLESALRKYLRLAQFEMKHMIQRVSRGLKFITFLLIVGLLSLFYLVLYYPLGIMEAL